PVRKAREILEEEGVEIVGLRARRVARQDVVERERLQIGETARDATDRILGEVRKSLIEPGRLKAADGRILEAIAGVDHVLEFVGDRTACSLSHRARTPDVSKLCPSRIRG